MLDNMGRVRDLLRASQSGDRIPVRARFSAPLHTCPGTHLANCTTDTVSFPAVKRLVNGKDHLPPSSALVKERTEIYLYFPLVLRDLLQCELAFTFIFDMLDKHKDSYLTLYAAPGFITSFTLPHHSILYCDNKIHPKLIPRFCNIVLILFFLLFPGLPNSLTFRFSY